MVMVDQDIPGEGPRKPRQQCHRGIAGGPERIDTDSSKRNDTAVLRIRDWGKGMDKETLRHLFIPFYSKKGSGTGLGMAVARIRSSRSTGGRITVSSRPAAGTKIAIHLPLASPTSRA